MAKPTWRWVSRSSKVTNSSEVIVWPQNRKLRKPSHEAIEDPFWLDVIVLCNREFVAATGLSLHLGECVKVQFSAKIVK